MPDPRTDLELSPVRALLSRETIDKIFSLQHRFNAATPANALRDALSMAATIADTMEEGGTVELHQADGTTRELKIPNLS